MAENCLLCRKGGNIPNEETTKALEDAEDGLVMPGNLRAVHRSKFYTIFCDGKEHFVKKDNRDAFVLQGHCLCKIFQQNPMAGDFPLQS